MNTNTGQPSSVDSFVLIPRPVSLRSPPSIKITTYSVHAYKTTSIDTMNEDEEFGSRKSLPKSSSKNSLYQNSPNTSTKPTELSRTQHKLMLQRQSFLADDRNHLDHPENMRRLTKELDRINREYKYVKQYHDPLILSLQRIRALQQQECLSSHTTSYVLQRRASSHTIQEYIKHFEEERRHSFSSVAITNKPVSTSSFISRLFGSAPHHSPFLSPPPIYSLKTNTFTSAQTTIS